MDVIFDDENTVQPDVFWISGANSLCKLGDDGYWYGAPDLVVEVLSPSTELRDRRDKFKLYQKFGVREYWLAHPVALYIEVFRLENGGFVPHGIFGQGESFISDVLGELVVSVDTAAGHCAKAGVIRLLYHSDTPPFSF
jgi:Uma2 family endonuclease